MDLRVAGYFDLALITLRIDSSANRFQVLIYNPTRGMISAHGC
ncbi:MAG: hypothetical protein ACN4GW_03965 [Desulforhopalus sp.]